MSTKPLVMVTGASSGIGASIAKLFASLGYPQLLLARRVEALEDMHIPNSLCRKVDVRDRSAVLAAVAEAEQRYGPVDLLVNNAGIMLPNDPVTQDPSEWDEMIDVNVKGSLNCIHAVAGPMKTRKHGTIINIGSVAGRKTNPANVVYCGTKFAVHAMSESLREELAPHNVRVSVVGPGAVATELVSHITNDRIKESLVKTISSCGGAMGPDSIAETVRFIYEMPQSVCIRELMVGPTGQLR